MLRNSVCIYSKCKQLHALTKRKMNVIIRYFCRYIKYLILHIQDIIITWLAVHCFFNQRAWYTVHCTNMMHSRKPSLWSPSPFLVNPENRYLYIQDNEIHVFLKHFHLIAHDINTVKHPWFSPCTSRNIHVVMFESWYVDFKTISVPFTQAVRLVMLLLWYHGVDWARRRKHGKWFRFVPLV